MNLTRLILLNCHKSFALVKPTAQQRQRVKYLTYRGAFSKKKIQLH